MMYERNDSAVCAEAAQVMLDKATKRMMMDEMGFIWRQFWCNLYRMSTPKALAGLAIALLIAIMLAISGLEALKITELSDQVTVLRAQAASHADMVLTAQSYEALNHRVGNMEFNMAGLNGAVGLLKARKDEVTTSDMKEFVANLELALDDLDTRLQPLELEYNAHHLAKF